MSGLHETFERPEPPLPSDRSTGLVFAAIAAVVAYVCREHAITPWVAIVVAVGFAAVSFAAPRLIRPLNIVWMRLAALLAMVMNPIVMLVLYAVAVVPAGLLMQTRHDPLRRTRKPGTDTYWIEREPGRRSSMTNQF